MRPYLFAFFVLLFSLPFGLKAIGSGGNTGRTDTLSTAKADNVAANRVQRSRIRISLADVNPDFNKVTRWDTNDIDMYHVDMTQFRDTLTYVFDRPADGHRYCIPKKGRITSGFGHRSLFGRKFHKGLDIDLETGDAVKAAMKGKVRIARYSGGYGNFVVISHEGGLETLYGHMSELAVAEGQDVFAGQIIGLGGSTGQSTGSHLHFEVRIFGEQIDPAKILDPATLMPRKHVVKIDASWFNHLARSANTEMVYHEVLAGETLDGISAMYEMAKETLVELNDLDPNVELAAGTRLRLE
ncbi:MAG TPA: LysM peptidoglycan-binding domain-containing protein [Bacteroidetes bacterium]|nr:LysM peptidoglycan-binding domain-containing protein [Bacteroidota bacterium]